MLIRFRFEYFESYDKETVLELVASGKHEMSCIDALKTVMLFICNAYYEIRKT